MKSILVIIPFFILTFSSLSAQEIWSLDRCINQALSQNLSYQQSGLAVKNSELDITIAKAARHPNLNGNIGLGWNFGRSIDPTTNDFVNERFFSNNYGLNSGVLLYNGNRLNKNIDRSKSNLRAASLDMDQARQDLTLNVALQYLNVLFSKENIEIAETQYNITNQQLNQINKSISAGIAPKSDALNIEAQLMQNEQAKIVAENNYSTALLQLKQIMNLDPAAIIDVTRPEEIEVTTDPFVITLDELYNESVQRRHDIKSGKIREEIAGMDMEIAQTGYYPSLSAFANLGTNYNNQAPEIVGVEEIEIIQPVKIDGRDALFSSVTSVPLLEKQPYFGQLNTFLSYGFGLGLNIPIYNNKVNRVNVERAKLNLENQMLSNKLLNDNLKQILMQTLTDAKAAKKKLEASEKSVEAQRLSYNNVARRLELGAGNSFEWQNQKSILQNLELTALIDKYDYIFKMKVLDFYLGKPLNH